MFCLLEARVPSNPVVLRSLPGRGGLSVSGFGIRRPQ